MNASIKNGSIKLKILLLISSSNFLSPIAVDKQQLAVMEKMCKLPELEFLICDIGSWSGLRMGY